MVSVISQRSLTPAILTLLLLAATFTLTTASAERPSSPNWHEGMTWVFENQDGQRSVTKIIDRHEVQSPGSRGAMETWSVRTTTSANGSVVISVAEIRVDTLKTVFVQTDIYTGSDHLRQVNGFDPAVPIPWYKIMQHRDDEVLSSVSTSRVLNGQPAGTSQGERIYTSRVSDDPTNTTVPFGTFETYEVTTSSRNTSTPEPAAEKTRFAYSPAMRYWVASWDSEASLEPGWVLVDAVLTQRPDIRVDVTPKPALVGDTIVLNASGTTDPDGTIESFEWGLDNGTHLDGPTIELSYDEPGRYPVVLTVTDNASASQRRTLFLRVLEQPTDLTIFAPDHVREDVRTQFRAEPAEELARLRWNFGDDSSEQVGSKTTHTFLEPGNYSITVSGVDRNGNAVEATHPIRVHPAQAETIPGESSTGDGTTGEPGQSSANQTGPHILSPGNGTLFDQSQQTFLVELADLASAEIIVPGGDIVPVSKESSGLVTATVPTNQGSVQVSLVHEGHTLDTVTLVPQSSDPPSNDGGDGQDGDDGEDDGGSNGAPGPGALLTVLLASLVGLVARRVRSN